MLVSVTDGIVTFTDRRTAQTSNTV